MKTQIKAQPGDLMRISVPHSQTNRKQTCVARLLEQKPKKNVNIVCMIIDVIIFATSDKKYYPGATIEIPQKDVLEVIPSGVNEVRADIMIEISNGSVIGLYRVDGKTEPFKVHVIDLDVDSNIIFNVDSFSAKQIASSNKDEPLTQGVLL